MLGWLGLLVLFVFCGWLFNWCYGWLLVLLLVSWLLLSCGVVWIVYWNLDSAWRWFVLYGVIVLLELYFMLCYVLLLYLIIVLLICIALLYVFVCLIARIVWLLFPVWCLLFCLFDGGLTLRFGLWFAGFLIGWVRGFEFVWVYFGIWVCWLCFLLFGCLLLFGVLGWFLDYCCCLVLVVCVFVLFGNSVVYLELTLLIFCCFGCWA